MTIDELIPLLQKLDPSTLVVVEEFGRLWNEKPAADTVTTRIIRRNGETYSCVVLKPIRWP